MPQPDVFFEIARFGREKKRGQLQFPDPQSRKADSDGRLSGVVSGPVVSR